MSTPRLILKQPTGWFAAGREFARALTLLSDGAFKLYVYACLRADRHTGCLRATVDELARAMTRAPTEIAMNLDELEAREVCGVVRNGGSQLVLEIRDRFWPYQKQGTPGCAPEPEAEFVARYAPCSWLRSASRPAFRLPTKRSRLAFIDEASHCSRSHEPSSWDVPASTSP